MVKMEFSRKFVSECREHSTYLKHVAAPLFRKSFTLSGAKAQEVPHSCLRVLEPVPQHDADDVLALAQIGGDVISVVVGDVVRVGDIGGQEAFQRCKELILKNT